MPATYRASDYPPFAVTVDLVVLTIRDDILHTLTVERAADPYAGRLALPGGFVHIREDLVDAARRELSEETGLGLCAGHLEQIGTYGRPDRDPRMRVVSVAYLALAADLPAPTAGTDAAKAHWTPTEPLLSSGPGTLAFDHDTILADGIERARAKVEYAPLATTFCQPTFTIGELRRVYEVVWGQPLDPRNFHRKATGTPGFVVETGTTTTRGGGRPAQLFRAGDGRSLTPPLTRPARHVP